MLFIVIMTMATHGNSLTAVVFVFVCVQSRLTICDSMDYSPPGSSVHGIFQPSILEWVAISYFRRSSQPRDWIHVSCISRIGRWILYHSCLPMGGFESIKIIYLKNIWKREKSLWHDVKWKTKIKQFTEHQY